MIQIKAQSIYTPDRVSTQAFINIKHGKVLSIGEPATSDSLTVYDLPDYSLVPGFVELQINGAFGVDFTNTPDQIWQVGRRLIELGITTFLPTIITSPLSAITNAMQIWLSGAPIGYNGAAIPGFHVEGPYLSLQKKGAHRQEFFRKPTPAEVSEWIPSNGIRMVTLAPELPGALEIISILSQRGILVSAGHSNASAEQVRRAMEAGISAGTHIFNAMGALDHRAANLVSVLLTEDHLKVGLIADGIHLAPEVVKIVQRCKGKGNIFLVSDAMAALGLSPGKYQLAGREVNVNETTARLEDGTLAGSILTATESLRNFVKFTQCSFEEALQCWTTTPAGMLHLENGGRLTIGQQADLVALDDHGRVAGTMIKGDWVFIAPWAKIEEKRIN
ncbi:MAG: N-acetylglucosamine-6-phosphate deacetylase [Chloroflexi bacterium 44-23]|nr:MAG: N-acetylglucosamine-6-phosphate deacetylase [Chloroflexi bacterium 44-23]